MSLEGKLALVTGASRGIGREIALQLSRNGAQVACVATTLKNSQPTADLILQNGGNAHAFAADVSQPDQVEQLFADVAKTLGDPLVLVNNAGITRDTLLLRMKDEDWQRVLEVNLFGAFQTIRAASRAMMKARWGRIVNVASVIGLHGGAGQANYAASKAGLIGLTMSVARELGSRGITCNAVAPGFIETEMTQDLSAEMRENVVKSAPLGRLGTPEDIAPVVAFLASDAAGYITGQTLTVDGGLYL